MRLSKKKIFFSFLYIIISRCNIYLYILCKPSQHNIGIKNVFAACLRLHVLKLCDRWLCPLRVAVSKPLNVRTDSLVERSTALSCAMQL